MQRAPHSQSRIISLSPLAIPFPSPHYHIAHSSHSLSLLQRSRDCQAAAAAAAAAGMSPPAHVLAPAVVGEPAAAVRVVVVAVEEAAAAAAAAQATVEGRISERADSRRRRRGHRLQRLSSRRPRLTSPLSCSTDRARYPSGLRYYSISCSASCPARKSPGCWPRSAGPTRITRADTYCR